MALPVLHFFDKETKWLHSGGETRVAPPGGMGKLVFEKLKEYAEKDFIFQIESETGNEESYKEFLTKSIKIALYLRDQGLQAGDIIAMCSQNNMNNFAVFIAALFNGIILASTDPLISVTDSKYLLELVEPKLLFVCEKSMDVSKKATEEKPVKISTLYEHNSLDNVPEILRKYTNNDVELFKPYYAVDNKEIINLFFSSGTTGLPKASCFNHNMLFVDARSALPFQARGTIFTTLYWTTTAGFALTLLMAGCIRINIRQVTPEETWECLHKTKCNAAFFSYGLLAQCLPHLKQAMPYLTGISSGGGLVPMIYQNMLKEKLPNTRFFRIYGATEIGGVTSILGGHPTASAGTIMPKNIIVKIVDIETEEAVNLNVLGEIRVKGNPQLNGYYKRDTSGIWDSEGFYRTGDLGYLTDNYELYVVDRIKEMFKYRGYHVVPEKIENVLVAHPAVKQAIVVPVPHLTDDSHAKGLVVLKDGCTATADELIKFTNDNIEDDRNHLRGGVQFICESTIPYTATAKINRRILKQMYAN